MDMAEVWQARKDLCHRVVLALQIDTQGNQRHAERILSSMSDSH